MGQYSASTTASVQDEVFKWLLKKTGKPEHLIVSFHGVPRRYLLLGDPYHCHCQKTGRLIKEKLKWPDNKFTVSFQSRFGPEEWLKPYTDETLIELAKNGTKKK